MVRPAGIEPALPAPEAGALSPELRAHILFHGLSATNNIIAHTPAKMQTVFLQTSNKFPELIYAVPEPGNKDIPATRGSSPVRMMSTLVLVYSRNGGRLYNLL